MAFTISAEDSRSIKALEIAAGASSWIKCTSRDGRRQFVGIPSQCKPGTYYLVDAQNGTCDCQDFKRHGLSRQRLGDNGFHGGCKHLRAQALHAELVKAAEQATPKRRRLEIVKAAARYDRIFGEEPAF